MSEAQGKLLQGEMNMTLNMTIMTSARDAVGKCLATLGGEYDNMLVLTADVDTSSRIQAFKEKYPDRCYNVGIAEQNLMSVSAGLAHEGFRPLAFAFAPFASMRCYEQVRTDICYSKLPVVIIGNGAGYSNGASGCTHCALEDSALMVACNNMTVLEPGDPFQIAKLLEAAMELNAPVYIRLGREATSSLYPEDTKYEIGKALIPREATTVRSSAPASWSTLPWKPPSASTMSWARRSALSICSRSNRLTSRPLLTPQKPAASSQRRTTTCSAVLASWSARVSQRRALPASWSAAAARTTSSRSRTQNSSTPATAWTPTACTRQ